MIPHAAVLLDLDGTVYRGADPVPHAAETIRALLEAGKHIRYITNNSAARPEQITQKLTGMGVPCEPDWVYGSGPAAATHCRNQGCTQTYVIGEPNLHQTFQEAGLDPASDQPQAVVVGICRTFTYAHLDQAMQHIRNGAVYIATNLDPTYPLEGGRFSPGSGTINAAVQTATGVQPLVIGKPSPLIPLQICHDLNLPPDQALLVGDRLDTDIAAGQAAGCPTWLVLTGVETQIPPNQPGSPNLQALL